MITIENFENIVGKGINDWHVVDVYQMQSHYGFHIKATIGWIVNGNSNNIVNEVTVILHRNKDKWSGKYKLTTDYVTNPLSMITDIDTKDIENVNRFIYKLDKHIINLFK